MSSMVQREANDESTRPSALRRLVSRRAFEAASRKVEFGDFVLLLYVATFVRQYLWLVGSRQTAWALTVALTALVWLAHLWTKETAGERVPRRFWLVVALPLFVVYGMRAGLPDTSFDVLNYRLVNAERALGGWPLMQGDFFPAFYPLNPAPDMLLGITRRLLGYRLGTITNLLVLLWAGTILDRLLRPYVAGRWLRNLGVLLVLWTEHALFIVNNYMVDLLALPLLLLATEIALRPGDDGHERRDRVRLGLYLGAAVALKLLNLAYCIPVLLVYLYTSPKPARVGLKLAADAAWLAAAFALPLLPFTLFVWRETGNPVFPFY
ncbi:MAG: hypothetical protein LC754_19215, partial [Acidobacteria bacterium]|nr:hypothetical protein [Acidobacteriota bacterium]